MEQKESYLDFEAYERASEPHKREKASAWRTAIGLQAVDGLKVSNYLKETAVKHIEGEISIEEVRDLIKTYYVNKTGHDGNDEDTEEADRVSANIAKLINEQSFTFSASGLLSVHRHIFEGVFKHAGEIRTYDITKKEWVLRGDTVLYGRAQDILNALKYDIEQEQQFEYKHLSQDQIIEHIAKFVSMIWQNHPFREGNTRATAVFVIKYLRSCGFDVNNELFEENSWYFRNALVRANYRNMQKRIDPDISFLIKFFRNLILGEKHELKNRYLLIHLPEDLNNPSSYPSSNPSSSEVEYNACAISTQNEHIEQLVKKIGESSFTIKELMALMSLKDRMSFMKVYVAPSIQEGFVKLLYSDAPKHPRQKYLLTVKGLALYQNILKKK